MIFKIDHDKEKERCEKEDTVVPILASLISVHVPNVFINIDLEEPI